MPKGETAYIASCIESILRQEPPPAGFEVIVADGMSNDGTRKILQELSKSEHCLRIVDYPTGIVSTGFNSALNWAEAKSLCVWTRILVTLQIM